MKPEQPSVEQVFTYLADGWEHVTIFSSSISEIVEHPNYAALVGMGRDVIGLAVRRLQVGPFFWAYVLHDITGESPTADVKMGDIDAIRQSWLNLARERGWMVPSDEIEEKEQEASQ
jgi:hypothetical protein